MGLEICLGFDGGVVEKLIVGIAIGEESGNYSQIIKSSWRKSYIDRECYWRATRGVVGERWEEQLCM